MSIAYAGTPTYAASAPMAMGAVAAPAVTSYAAPMAAPVTTTYAAPAAAPVTTTYAAPAMPSYVPPAAPAVPAGPPASVLASMPDPATIAKQKDGYTKMLDDQLKQGTTVLAKQKDGYTKMLDD